MDFTLENHRSFIGSKVSDLPTPSLIISKPILDQNIAQLHEDVETAGITFRPHVKTLKSLEVTRAMLRNGTYRGIVCSTIPEIIGSLPLVKEGILDEAVYGIPVVASKLLRLASLRDSIRILLIIDHIDHINILEAFNSSKTERPWPVFIKVDVGSRRAGVPVDSPRLESLVRRALDSNAIELVGFYAHAGHSYGGRTHEAVEGHLTDEFAGLVSAAKLLDPSRKVVLSLGSTPTAHVIKALKKQTGDNIQIELHAGNFPCNDLQQVSTGLVKSEQQAIRLHAEVCSVYPERNEVLINAGTIAISKETSALEGFGQVVGKPGWYVQRTSQEHGVLSYSGSDAPVCSDGFKIGETVQLHISHSCITAASFLVYFIADERDVVVDTWIPWKGW